MAHKVIIKVTGHGQLNGNLRIDINQVMDSDLAQRLRVSKPALIQFVSQCYPGAVISENSLMVRINQVKESSMNESIPEKKEAITTKKNKERSSIVKNEEKLDKSNIQAEPPVKPNQKDQNLSNKNLAAPKSTPIKDLFVETGKNLITDYKLNKVRKEERGKHYTEQTNKLLQTTIPEELNEIIEFVNEMQILIKANPWINENSANNSYTDICLEKLKQAVEKLKQRNPSNNYKEYDKVIKRLKWSRFFKKNFN